MKNNDSGCGWLIGIPLMACIVIYIYVKYGLPGILVLFLVILAYFLLAPYTQRAEKAIQRRAIAKQRREMRRDSLLRQGICPECEVPLETVSSTSSPAGKYTEKEETPSRFQPGLGVVRRSGGNYDPEPVIYDVRWVKKQRILHTDQYHCSSCKKEFTHHHTSSHTV